MDSTKILEKIKKLLELSKDKNSTEEAATAAAAAQRLMIKYKISQFMLESAIGSENKEQILTQNWFEMQNRSTWKLNLCNRLGALNNCKVYIQTIVNDKKTNSIMIIGRESDVAITRYLYSYLQGEISRLSKIEGAGRGHTWANNFKVGATFSVLQRLEEKQKEDIKESEQELRQHCENNGVGLIHVSRAIQKLQEAKNEIRDIVEKLNLTQGKEVKIKYEQDGYFAGVKAGKEIELNHKKLSSALKKIKEN